MAAITRRIGDVIIECLVGDISAQDGIDAVVNAANAELRIGGGVAGALHSAAGPGLEMESRPLGPIEPGQAVITGGHRLPNRHVIHCLGPVYGVDEPSAALLAQCYRRALNLADEHGLDSIAFPSISTGAFGYPMQDAAEIAIRTVCELAGALRSVRRIRFVLYDDAACVIHAETLAALLDDG